MWGLALSSLKNFDSESQKNVVFFLRLRLLTARQLQRSIFEPSYKSINDKYTLNSAGYSIYIQSNPAANRFNTKVEELELGNLDDPGHSNGSKLPEQPD